MRTKEYEDNNLLKDKRDEETERARERAPITRRSSNDTTTSHVQHNAASCRPRTVPSPGGTATAHVRLSSKGEDCSLHERMAFHFPDFAEATCQRATPTGDIANGLAQSAGDERGRAVIDPR